MGQYIYLAGPEVFFPEADEIFRRKKALCGAHGFCGLAPLDNAIEADPEEQKAFARSIFLANEKLMQQADFCIANITPFRGVSADTGTVYEIGYLRGIGKPVYAYSCTDLPYAERVLASDFAGSSSEADRDGMMIENFDLADNLMIPFGVEASGGEIVTASGERAERAGLERNLQIFEEILRRLSSR